MRKTLVAMAALLCSVVWLVLLVATSFNAVVVSVGLLGALALTGSPRAHVSANSKPGTVGHPDGGFEV